MFKRKSLTAELTLGEPPVNTYVDPYKGEKWFYFNIVPSRATFLAVLPGPAPAIRVQPKQPRVKCGERIGLAGSRTDVGASVHAIKLRGFGPDGSAVEGWSQVILTGAEPVSVSLPVAFNDPAGTYRMTLTDVITRDTEVEIEIDVENE